MYNRAYQAKYVNRYVFKLNTKHDQELIRMLEKMDNRSAWFKEMLRKELKDER
ncbi:MAG: hypothetical protein IJ120_08465 [Solobacterium sp.]|nr:hypothetical protein [Solobacterium sp.]